MQTYNQSDIGDSTIRSSKLRSYESCSFLYFCSYILGIPQKKNQGSEKGNCCHDLLEMLGSPKHRHIYDLIIKTNTIYSHKPIEKLIKLYIKNSETLKPDFQTLDHIDKMMLVGLKENFFVEGGQIIAHEYKFEITNKEPYYKIKGFMDKVAIKDDYVLIFDYKSSKKIYEGVDKESNTQSLIYHTAAKHIWPDKKIKVIFIFLAHPDNPILETEFSNETLNGFQYYLEDRQKQLDKFTGKESTSNMAAGKPYPEDKSFGGSLLCGYGKYPGHIKPSTKEPYWVCPCKWSMDYFIVKKDGKTQYSVLDSTKIKLKEGETIEKAHFSGCPAFASKNDVLSDFNNPIKGKTAHTMVLDDIFEPPKPKFDPLADF